MLGKDKGFSSPALLYHFTQTSWPFHLLPPYSTTLPALCERERQGIAELPGRWGRRTPGQFRTPTSLKGPLTSQCPTILYALPSNCPPSPRSHPILEICSFVNAVHQAGTASTRLDAKQSVLRHEIVYSATTTTRRADGWTTYPSLLHSLLAEG